MQQRFDVYESDKKHIMHLLGERYKDNKAKFKSLFYRPSETPESVIARGGPKSMHVSEFVDMVTYWYSLKGKSISEKNKASRSNLIGAHALGRTSLANRRKELAAELGKEPTRLELYINSRTRKSKDNSLVDDYAISKKGKQIFLYIAGRYG
ncbi:hypothetical protein KSP40_PGU006148 [Platanthera guangdongensis]|uniref:Uncharacterized protein n=1 Tax=Platanthera guangdongensis TaxID=2320717 RepID=A0ABR2MQY4_9ASPA